MKVLIVANWKCNPTTLEQAQQLFDSIKQGIGDLQDAEIIICPPFAWLPILKRASAYAKGYGGLAFGSQNCFWEQSGAFTGEISPKMLKSLGCKYVILGHSERRRYLNETDEMINRKLKAALEIGLKPILCVGDKGRESEQDIKQIQGQLEKALTGISRSDLSQIILVYEPIWAISTTKNGIAASPESSAKGKLFIQKVFNDIFSHTACPKIIYGGSVNSKNAKDYIGAGFHGLLVGQASLDAKEFIKIVRSLA